MLLLPVLQVSFLVHGAEEARQHLVIAIILDLLLGNSKVTNCVTQEELRYLEAQDFPENSYWDGDLLLGWARSKLAISGIWYL